MDKIKKFSRRVRLLLQIIFYLIPIFILWFWLVFHTSHDIFGSLGIGTWLLEFFGKPVTINTLTRILGFIATMLPAGIMMYGIRQLIKLFKNYELGQIFTLANANYYRKLGYTLFALVIGRVIYSALISFIMTFQNVPGQRVAGLTFVGIDIISLITGGIIIIIAWVMQEAYKISHEQELVI